MNCQQIKDELMLLVGSDQVPDDLQKHLDTCDDCRKFWSELVSLTEGLGADDEFRLDRATIEAAVSNIDRRIDLRELDRVVEVGASWKAWVPAAAAMFLLVGISLIVYMVGGFGDRNGKAELPTKDSTWVIVENGELDALDENAVAYILHQSASYEMLGEDLTDEELEYLENNFDVGDIL